MSTSTNPVQLIQRRRPAGVFVLQLVSAVVCLAALVQMVRTWLGHVDGPPVFVDLLSVIQSMMGEQDAAIPALWALYLPGLGWAMVGLLAVETISICQGTLEHGWAGYRDVRARASRRRMKKQRRLLQLTKRAANDRRAKRAEPRASWIAWLVVPLVVYFLFLLYCASR